MRPSNEKCSGSRAAGRGTDVEEYEENEEPDMVDDLGLDEEDRGAKDTVLAFGLLLNMVILPCSKFQVQLLWVLSGVSFAADNLQGWHRGS